jgi:hypothetical protein
VRGRRELSYADMDALESWARQELSPGELGHADRDARAAAMLAAMARRPGGTVPGVFRDGAARKAAYRFLSNEAFGWRELAAAQQRATAARVAALDTRWPYLVGIVDGSSLSHTDRACDDGVGPIGSRSAGGRGIKTSVALLLTPSGVELGIGALALWARPEAPAATPHARRALGDKESRWWVELPRATEAALGERGVRTPVWWQFDSEADMWPVLARAPEPGHRFTVRQHCDRVLTARRIDATSHPHLKVLAALEAAPPCGELTVEVRRAPGRTARRARLRVTVLHVGVRLRTAWSHGHVGDVGLTVVWAREVEGSAPPAEPPLDWVLWTNAPAASFPDAALVVRNYALRFRIEGVHFAWKSGCCDTEDAQHERFEALAKWATLQLSVAVHREAILHRARVEPDLPADVAFDREQIDAALLLYRGHRKAAPPAGYTPTLAQMVDIIARLGGYTGKSSGGPPGLKTFGRGMDDVDVAATVLRMQRDGPGTTT